MCHANQPDVRVLHSRIRLYGKRHTVGTKIRPVSNKEIGGTDNTVFDKFGVNSFGMSCDLDLFI